MHANAMDTDEYTDSISLISISNRLFSDLQKQEAERKLNASRNSGNKITRR